MSIFIAPHDIYSHGAKELAKALKAVRIFPEKSRYKYRRGHVVINWGRSSIPWYRREMNVFNRPENVSKAICKIDTFNALRSGNVSVPDFSTSINDAKTWITQGFTVFCRTLTRASAGKGIVVAREAKDLVKAPLYVKYKKKKSEFRVAVIGGKVIDFTQKKRAKEGSETESPNDNLIRSHEKGWVFCRESVTLPNGVANLAIQAVKVLGLDFGAVDIIYNEKEKQAYVLEVNTAMGLEGTSINRYGKAFTELVSHGNVTPIV